MAVKCEYHCFKSDELSLYLTILQSNFPFKCMNKHLSSLLAHNFLYDISHYLLYKLQNFINYVFCATFLIEFSRGAIFNSFFLKILKNMLWFTGPMSLFCCRFWSCDDKTCVSYRIPANNTSDDMCSESKKTNEGERELCTRQWGSRGHKASGWTGSVRIHYLRCVHASL